MAGDLAATPTSGLVVQACGDAHLSNFGFFASPERHLVFDINDFDETLPGPWEWDVKRLAASLEIAARDRGFAQSDGARDRRGCGAVLPRGGPGVRRMPGLDVWYALADVETRRDRYERELDRESEASGRGLTKARARTTSVPSPGSPRGSTAGRGSRPTRR